MYNTYYAIGCLARLPLTDYPPLFFKSRDEYEQLPLLSEVEYNIIPCSLTNICVGVRHFAKRDRTAAQRPLGCET